jgi:hypothetical protein
MNPTSNDYAIKKEAAYQKIKQRLRELQDNINVQLAEFIKTNKVDALYMKTEDYCRINIDGFLMDKDNL